MDLSHIAHFIQREGEELLGYHPFDEGSDREPEDEAQPEAQPMTGLTGSWLLQEAGGRAVRVLVDGVEDPGARVDAHGNVTLSPAPVSGEFTIQVEWEPAVRIVEHTGELDPCPEVPTPGMQVIAVHNELVWSLDASRIFTAAEVTTLYNAGRGVAYGWDSGEDAS